MRQVQKPEKLKL